MLHLNDTRSDLVDNRGRVFDPAARAWVTGEPDDRATAVTSVEAVAWLQRESGHPCRVPIGVIGGRQATPPQLEVAEAVGAGLARLGLTMICGGRGGVMEAACRGVAGAGGLSIGLLPDTDWSTANRHVGVPLATGIGPARNAVIARAALALIAVGGGTGTLSEVAFGLQFGRPVFALEGAPTVDGTIRLADWQALEEPLCRVVLGL